MMNVGFQHAADGSTHSVSHALALGARPISGELPSVRRPQLLVFSLCEPNP